MRLLGLVRRRRLTRPDRPDRLVRDDQRRRVDPCHAVEALLDLGAKYVVGLARLAFFEEFADTQDHDEARVERRFDLAIDQVVGLAENVSTLGVADDYVSDADVLEHVGTHLAREGALGLKVHVLRADGDVRPRGRLHDRRQIHEGRTDTHFDIGTGGVFGHRRDQVTSHLGRRVHFPVAENRELSH